MIRENLVLLKNFDMVLRKIAGEFLLIPVYQKDSKNQFVFSLNETGKQIWELIDNKKSIKEIVEILMDKFDMNGDQIEKDVVDFVNMLQKIGGISYGMSKSATD